MPGLLDTGKQPVGGLLGAPSKLGLADYALALLTGGVGGAAGLALNNRMQQRRYAQAQPILSELQAAFTPTAGVSKGPMGPGLDGMPMGSRQPAKKMPGFGEVAPLLLRAQQAGIDTSPYEGVMKGVADERKANEPTYYNTRLGILQRDPQAGFSMAYEVPEEVKDDLPLGYRRRPDGRMEIDPDYLAGQRALTAGRRDEVVSRPMPGKPRAASRGPAQPKPPGGFIVDP